ncbi:copper resistance protein CopC [Sinomonas sp. ASV486]|uniref:copper resistance CopC family protein n=1 Tax=Sinomonas sp. ASV486 TaxID=3051170 RepID=UPI0027DC49A8|nr:copper resistance protein CopC [Sinomonas sp. ASV486]MDQ4491754.1 copper resistance protein CopC [Sinomonas sp. ASV486]
MRTPSLTVLRKAATAALLAAAMLLPAAAAAQAHDVIESTNPADGSTVQMVPDSVVLTFDHTPIAIGTEIQVKDPSGTNVSNGPANIVDTNVTQPIKPGAPAGVYTVVWRVVSADSHPIEGTFTFTAKAAASGSAAASTGAQSAAASGPATAAPASSGSNDGGLVLWLVIAVVAVAAVVGLAFFVRRAVARGGQDTAARD